MSRNTPSFVRALSVVAASALAIAGIAVVAPAAIAAPASTATVAYNSISSPLPPSYPSVGFQARSTSEFGDEVQLAAGTARTVTSVTVGLVDWACQSDFTKAGGTWTAGTGGPCVTTPGASFTHPITLNLYDVVDGTTPTLGKLIASVTQTVTVPFRPSANASCVDPTSWKDPTSGSCQHGYAFKATFPVAAYPVVADRLVVTVAYNTSNHGAAPIHVPGPYDSLNVAVGATPTVGTDVDPDQMFQNSTWAGAYADNGAAGTGTLRADTDWTSSPGLSLSITTDDSVLPTASQQVTVRQKDVDPVEDANTYTRWHEGKNNATPAYSVHPDGLHLGDGAASTIIKGTDVANSEVTQSQLRQLLATASLTVASGTATMQVPVNFGNSVSDHFTTLRSVSLASGTHTLSLSDMWATTRAFGPYSAQQEVTLGDLLSTLFSQNAHVWLAGYGVQADTSAVVPNIVWGTTSFTFNQPEIAACATPTTMTATNLVSNGWTFGQSRANGVNRFTANGLHVFTTPGSGSPDPRKAAGYHAADFDLANAGIPTLTYSGTPIGVLPSVQLAVDFNGDGVADGTLVGESIYGNDYWLSNSASQFVKDGAPLHTGGYGSSNHGTLDQWLVAFPTAHVVQVGYSLGSGVNGDSVIQSITAGCVVYGFTTGTVPTPTATVQVPDTAIRPNETTYAGWHEGYTNSSRSFSVESNGLHLGSPSHSQIINGLSGPLATSNLESVLTAMSTTVVSGSVTLQVPVVYGPSRFTTLYSSDLSAGVHGVSVSDAWTTTRAILDANGSTLVAAGSTLPLADLNALLTSLGGVQVLAFGVQADSPAVVSDITAQGTDYQFVPTALPAVSSTVTVRDSQIAQTESASTYQQWHEGYQNTTPQFSTAGSALKLGIADHSQIVKGVGTTLANASTTAALLETAQVVVSSGSVTYQVPVYYGSGTSFTTLHSDSLGAGTFAFTLSSMWASSKTIVTTGVTIQAGQLYPLGDLLDALTNVRVLAFGVQADADATVSSISWNSVKYVFAPTVQVTRLTGDTRYDVGVAISQRFTPGLDIVYLAAGGNYPDALSAAPVAAKNGAPLLLTPTSALTAPVVAELIRLHPHKVIVVGGPASVNQSVLSQVSALSFSPVVTRITGEDRYEVSRSVSASAFSTSHTVYIASGENFPDALAAAPAAAKNGSPVILVPGSQQTVDVPTLALLHNMGVTDVIIAGGPATVSPGIATQLGLLYNVHRKSGSTRYDTPVQVNQGLFTSANEVFIATGQNFPDALSGAALAGVTGSPLFLATTTCIPQAALAAINALNPNKITLLGGPASLTSGIYSLTPCTF